MPRAKSSTTTPRARRTSKPTGALAAFADTKKAPTVLIGAIQSHSVKKAMEDNDRRQDIIHPSEMAKADWCPRSTVYRISGVEPSNSAPSKSHRMETIFQEGHDIHAKWQTWLGEMGRLWGSWWCPVCKKEDLGLGQFLCHRCGGERYYREVKLNAEKTHLIVGHADGMVPDVDSLIEIKSIGLGTLRMEEPELVAKYTVKVEDSSRKIVDYDALWKGIKRPLKSHRKQAMIYLFLCRELGIPATQMVFIYENKANQDTKEFVIKYDEDFVKPLIDQALDVKWAVENNRLIPRSQEYTKELKPCSDCVFRDTCYGETTNDEARDTKQDSRTGAGVSRGKAEVGPAADLHAHQTGRRVPRTSGRPHRTGRRSPDEAVRSTDEVGRVPGSPTGSSRGRRTVRRRVPRES